MAEPPQDWVPYLGHKVSIRFRLHDDPDHPFSEAIGVIQSVDPSGDVSIVTRAGSAVTVSSNDIVAAKIWP